MTRFAADLDRALGLSQAIARAAQAAAAAVDRTRLAIGLGTEEETARGNQAAAQRRVSGLDARAAEQDAAIAEARASLIPSGLSGDRLALAQRVADQDPAIAALRQQRAVLDRERAAALADLDRYNQQVDHLERAAWVQRFGERIAAEEAAREGQRRRDEVSLAELRKALDKERGIREQHAQRVAEIGALLSRGSVEPAEAQRLRAAADKERDEALAKLEDRTERTGRATERLTEAEKELQRLVERGVSLVASAATEAEKYAQQVRALDAALAAGKITQDGYNRAVEQLDPAAKAAREALAKAQQEAEQFAQQSRAALGKIGENALDRLGQGLVNAFAQGGKAALDFGTLAKSILTSVVADLAKLAVINPAANAVFGTNRPTLGGAFGSGGETTGVGGMLPGLGSLFGGGSWFSGVGNALGLTGQGGLFTGIGSSISNWDGLLGGGIANAVAVPAAQIGAASPEALLAAMPATPTAATSGISAIGAFGGIAGGLAAGTMTSSLVGGIRGTVGPGGMIGAAAGTALGFLVGGPVGAIIGGALGGAGGALFGPTKKGMASRAGGDVFYAVQDGRIVITDARGKRWDQGAAVGEVQAALDQANQGAASRGLTFAGVSGAWGFGQASRSQRGLNEASLVAALRSDNPTITTALGTLAGRGAGLGEAFSAADFVRQSFEPLVRLAGPIDQVAEAIQKVGEQFDAATQRARELGLATDTLNAARQREIDKITLRRDATALNTIASQQNTLLGFLNGITAQGLSPQAALTEAQAQFGSALDAARSAGLGRADLSRVVSAGQTLLDAGRSFYASGPGAAELQQFVTASISNLGAQFDLPAFGGSLDAAVETLTGLTDEVALLRDEVARLRDELRSARLLRVA